METVNYFLDFVYVNYLTEILAVYGILLVFFWLKGDWADIVLRWCLNLLLLVLVLFLIILGVSVDKLNLLFAIPGAVTLLCNYKTL